MQCAWMQHGWMQAESQDQRSPLPPPGTYLDGCWASRGQQDRTAHDANRHPPKHPSLRETSNTSASLSSSWATCFSDFSSLRDSSASWALSLSFSDWSCATDVRQPTASQAICMKLDTNVNGRQRWGHRSETNEGTSREETAVTQVLLAHMNHKLTCFKSALSLAVFFATALEAAACSSSASSSLELASRSLVRRREALRVSFWANGSASSSSSSAAYAADSMQFGQ